MNPIPYGRQEITDDDVNAVVEVLRSDFLTQGPQIAKFEEAFARYIGSKYAVSVANGTAALHLSALAMGVKAGDGAITTPITFAASANCILYCGGNVAFADIDSETYLIDIQRTRRLLESSPKNMYKGLIPVDFAGRPVDMEELRELADEFGLWIIEDACHAPGGYFVDSKGIKQRCGNCKYTELAVFSFHPVKHITAGEGGMITTNNEELYTRLLMLRAHGITRDPNLLCENHGGWYYEMQALGFNYRLTDFQAALGLSQLKRADAGLEKRRKIAAIYEKAFSSSPFIRRQPGLVDGHSYHLYVIEVDDRKGLYGHLRGNNVFGQVHYIPVHLLPYYRQFGYQVGDFPHAEAYYKRCISLPMFPSLTEDELDYVIKTVLGFVSHA
jgi:UDP-4-amino-4,6-dideoxy-N-acetyl-beta-L-altrosamine transaminase